jgi:hypothetical protein
LDKGHKNKSSSKYFYKQLLSLLIFLILSLILELYAVCNLFWITTRNLPTYDFCKDIFFRRATAHETWGPLGQRCHISSVVSGVFFTTNATGQPCQVYCPPLASTVIDTAHHASVVSWSALSMPPRKHCTTFANLNKLSHWHRPLLFRSSTVG